MAYDTGRSGWRTFRADRISLRTPGGGRFTPRPLPSDDLAMWVSQRVATARWRHRGRVTVFAPAADVAARIGPYTGVVSPGPAGESGEACVLDTGSDSLPALAAYLGLLGWDFRVESPAELADHVRALADRYRRAAGPWP